MKNEIIGIKTKHGIYQVYCVEGSQYHPTQYCHEDEMSVRDRIWNIEKGSLILDIGAAYGSYTLSALLQEAAMVYAWSPESGIGDANEKEFLEHSLRLNGWDNKAIIYNNGIFNQNGWIDTVEHKFYLTSPEVIANPHHFIKVSPLDDWYNSIKEDLSIYENVWMKIDVEGVEVEVLKSATETIKALQPKIIIENHLFLDASIPEKVKEILSSIDYEEHSTVPYHHISHSLYLPKEK